MRIRLKVGQEVMVISGKDSGKKGVITRVFVKDRAVTVKNLNMQVKHVKKTQEKAGEKITFEAPLDVSNVMLIDSKGGVTRVGVRTERSGKRVYIEKTTGKEIKSTFNK